MSGYWDGIFIKEPLSYDCALADSATEEICLQTKAVVLFAKVSVANLSGKKSISTGKKSGESRKNNKAAVLISQRASLSKKRNREMD